MKKILSLLFLSLSLLQSVAFTNVNLRVNMDGTIVAPVGFITNNQICLYADLTNLVSAATNGLVTLTIASNAILPHVTNLVASATNTMGIGYVPIGAIVAWYPAVTGVPALPASFVQCDGQTLTDAQSPLNGQVIPNLNNVGPHNNNDYSGYFLVGNTTSGTAVGSDSHSHTVYDNGTGMGYPDVYAGASYGTDFNAATDTHIHNLGIMAYTDNQYNTPPAMTVIWIMRIK